MIEIQGVRFRYDSEAPEALKGIDLTIPDGIFLVVAGHNGSGKSTLSKHINGLLLPTEGQVLVNGLDTKNEDDLLSIRQQVGMVFQNPDMKGFEYGMGFKAAEMSGSEYHDVQNPDFSFKTNHDGGIQGGITNGEDVYFRIAFKPIPSVRYDRETVDFEGNPVVMKGSDRNDLCVAPRVLPVVEAMVAMVAMDFWLKQGRGE